MQVTVAPLASVCSQLMTYWLATDRFVAIEMNEWIAQQKH
jgi:hypothetical protein